MGTKYLEKYVGTKTYMYPNGALATPETILADFPACLTFTHVIETDVSGEVMFAIQNLSAMRTMYDIDSSLDEADAIVALQTAINTTTDTSTTASATERIAAALEYQNLLSLAGSVDLSSYTTALDAVTEADYTSDSWATYQLVVAANVVTSSNTQTEIDTATANITTAQASLVKATTTTDTTTTTTTTTTA
jgi:hypothetical protein